MGEDVGRGRWPPPPMSLGKDWGTGCHGAAQLAADKDNAGFHHQGVAPLPIPTIKHTTLGRSCPCQGEDGKGGDAGSASMHKEKVKSPPEGMLDG